MTGEEYQASFKAGLHYGIWKAAAEINYLAVYMRGLEEVYFLHLGEVSWLKASETQHENSITHAIS
jgi:hypothetical protein